MSLVSRDESREYSSINGAGEVEVGVSASPKLIITS